MAHTTLWDAAYEAIPADTDLANTLGDVIRDLKRDIRERLEVDHDFDDVTNAGQHKKVTLQEQGVDPSAVADCGLVYTKDVGAVTELFYRDSAGTVLQLTSGGKIGGGAAVDFVLANNRALQGKDTGGTARDLAKVDASDRTVLGSTALATVRIQAATLAGVKAYDGVTERDVVAYPKGYLGGLRIDIAADADHDVTISAHQGRSFDDTINYDQAAAMTKRIDSDWVAGNNNGGMATGLLAPSTSYFIYAIFGASGSPLDFGFDTSATAVNILAAAGGAYTKYREIGRLRTDGVSNIESFAWKTLSDLYELESNEVAFALGSQHTITNIFGRVPRDLRAYLRCKVAEGTYAIGDEVAVATWDDGATLGGTLWASTTLFGWVTFSNIRFVQKTNPPNGVTLTAANWRVVFRAAV